MRVKLNIIDKTINYTVFGFQQSYHFTILYRSNEGIIKSNSYFTTSTVPDLTSKCLEQ